MDYTDGSKEAKLLQELLHLIEEAILRGGGIQGNFAELIWKEMKKNGPSSGDFSTLLIPSKYTGQYSRMLKQENVPFLQMPDVHENMVLIVRSEDRERALDVDACIKKGSSDYTRTEFVDVFLKNARKLGEDVYRLKMFDSQTHDMLASKSFDHPAGFVSSYSDGHLYFTESASDSNIATLFLETSLSSVEGSFLGNVKHMNHRHEAANLEKVLKCMENGDTMNFVNIFDNTSDYLRVVDGVLEVHSFHNGMNTVLYGFNIKDYGVGKNENLREKIKQELDKLHNCECIGDGELEVYLKKSSGQLAAEREAALYEAAGLMADLKTATDLTKIKRQGIYLAMDPQTLRDTGELLRKKLEAATEPVERAELERRLDANTQFISLKAAQQELIGAVEREVRRMKNLKPGYADISPMEKLEFQRNAVDYVLKNRTCPEVDRYLGVSGMDPDMLAFQYEDCFGKIELVPDSMDEQILSTSQIQAQTPPMMM